MLLTQTRAQSRTAVYIDIRRTDESLDVYRHMPSRALFPDEQTGWVVTGVSSVRRGGGRETRRPVAFVLEAIVSPLIPREERTRASCWR